MQPIKKNTLTSTHTIRNPGPDIEITLEFLHPVKPEIQFLTDRLPLLYRKIAKYLDLLEGRRPIPPVDGLPDMPDLEGV